MNDVHVHVSFHTCTLCSICNACGVEKLRSENVDLKQQMTLKAAPTKGNSKDSSAKVKELEALVARAAAENETLLMELKQVTPTQFNDYSALCLACQAMPVLLFTYLIKGLCILTQCHTGCHTAVQYAIQFAIQPYSLPYRVPYSVPFSVL